MQVCLRVLNTVLCFISLAFPSFSKNNIMQKRKKIVAYIVHCNPALDIFPRIACANLASRNFITVVRDVKTAFHKPTLLTAMFFIFNLLPGGSREGLGLAILLWRLKSHVSGLMYREQKWRFVWENKLLVCLSASASTWRLKDITKSENP